MSAHVISSSKRAFSLVELSIVLVILGLLVGGVLAGQSLIRAAELRAISTEYSRWVVATQTFRDKYFAVPGDMANATSFWGVAHATPATCRITAGTGTQTCDGNGTGTIESTAGSQEDARFWQHLANAGLIEGSYTGIAAGTPSAPHTKADGSAYWFPWTYGAQAATTSDFGGTRGNVLEMFKLTAAFYVVNPQELWNIDTKLDDGIPNKGKVWSNKGDTTYPCTTLFNQLSDVGAAYNLSYSGTACYIQWLQAF